MLVTLEIETTGNRTDASFVRAFRKLKLCQRLTDTDNGAAQLPARRCKNQDVIHAPQIIQALALGLHDTGREIEAIRRGRDTVLSALFF